MKSCIKKLNKCLKKDTNIRFIVCYKTTKMSFYTNTKDKTLFERTEKHAYPSKKKNDQSAIFEHMSTCTHYDHIWDLFDLNINDVHRRKFAVNQIRDNPIVLYRCSNWNKLLFKEALMIKRHCPTLNISLRASKELQLL